MKVTNVKSMNVMGEHGRAMFFVKVETDAASTASARSA